eukprot:381974-Pyramimonas_sp.AAC.1
MQMLCGDRGAARAFLGDDTIRGKAETERRSPADRQGGGYHHTAEGPLVAAPLARLVLREVGAPGAQHPGATDSGGHPEAPEQDISGLGPQDSDFHGFSGVVGRAAKGPLISEGRAAPLPHRGHHPD